MRVSIVLEQRFLHTAGGETYNDGHATYPVWARYLAVFEEVQVVGRSALVEVVPPGYQRVDGPGVRVRHIPSYHGPRELLRRLPAVWWALGHTFEPGEAVILRVSGILANLSAPLLRLRRQPFAVEVINDPYLGFGGESPKSAAQRVLRWAFTAQARAQCRWAVAAQYVTHAALQRRYPTRPTAPRFGVSDVYLPPEAFAAPRAYSTPALRAVLVGSLDQPHKAVDVVLRALAALRAEGLQLHFTMVGDGLLRPEIEALARDLGVWEHCAFVGQRSTPAQVRGDLARADLFLMPSRTEGLPRALIEAMAQGLPAIASDVGGIPELLPTDVLVEPGSVESLTRVWRAVALDPARLSAASDRNFRVASTYADEVLDSRRRAFLRTVRRETTCLQK
ncbi:glycosyltransferase [Deinococcus ruber]|uniref:Uncharacterized protein n=1 Tax=Deinococcus ruber TaxID=1848197 RepID=A0A918C7P7_9DEIO|nr:glycosyltransferase [Deinococcus ruber]GGR10681.1 hypothetical protein GCM10008957_24250 [Deinococcus ruber]